MRTIKVLHILYSGLGGHGNVFFSMVNADADKNFEYEAIFAGIEEMREEYKERCAELGIKYQFIKKQPGKHVAFFYKMTKAVRSSDAQIVFIHGGVQLPPVWVAKMLSFKKRKLIVRETQALHLKSQREKIALRIAMKTADRIVFLSDAYALQVQKDLKEKYNHSITSVIPNGIDLNVFSPKNDTREDVIYLGMQSRIVSIKDHITLIDAFDLLKKKSPSRRMLLFIAGDGDRREELESKVKRLGLEREIIFEGMLSESALPGFLQKLDIYIHASFGETMSTAIMQAMACGKAIIASDVDGINNMIEHGSTGLLVKIKDKDEMASAIEKLISNTDLRMQLGASALKHAQMKFSDRQMFLNYKKLFTT